MRKSKKLAVIVTAIVIFVSSITFVQPRSVAADVGEYIPLAVGETYKLPADCDAISLDTNVANISAKGVVTGRNLGTTTIAYADKNGLHKFNVIVAADKSGFYGEDVKGCTLDLTDINYTLDVRGTSDITFVSNTPEIVSVDNEGRISSLAEGTGYITASMDDDTISIPVKVVRKKLQYAIEEFKQISLAESDISIAPNVLDTAVTITYLSGDTSIATVTSDGRVTPVNPGLTTITVTAANTTSAAGFTEIVYVQCIKATRDMAIADISLAEGESYTVPVSGKLETGSACVTITGNQITAVKAGVAKVTASLPATDVFSAQTISFNVTVTPKQTFKLTNVTARVIGDAKYHDSAVIEIEATSDNVGTIPVTIRCNDTDVYLGTADVKQGTNTIRINTEVLQSVGTQQFKAVIGSESYKFSVAILPPDFKVTINDAPQFIKAGEFIQIGYTVTATGELKDLQGPLQLMLDGEVLATEQIELSSLLSTKKSTINAYVPKTLADGQHRLRLCVVLNGLTNALFDETVVNASNPNMGLSVNGQVVSTVDTYVYSASKTNMTLTLAALNAHEQIETISLDDKTYSVKKNSTTIDLALAKSEEQVISVVVRSADGSDEKTYALTVIRANDDTAIVGEFEDTQGNVYSMSTESSPYRLCLPADVYKGALTVKVEDSSARIVSLNGKGINKASGTCSISLPDTGELTVAVEVQAGDITVHIPYSILITNVNYTPEVQVTNSSEITNRIYGSTGVLVGDKLITYGTESTSVEAAISTGHTKGLVIDLAVSDYNYNQYLGGYITIDDTIFPIHWNSFDGPLRELAADIKHGYIYVDSASFDHDANITTYAVTVADYTDEFVEDSISKTTTSVTFGVNVLADNFSLVFDDASEELIVETSSREFTLSMRKSSDNGITWTDPIGCGLRTKLTDPGTIMYEVTLTDSMQNTTVKTITAALSDSGNLVDGANVFISASRHADYVYINTSKSNSDTIDIKIADIFHIS